MARQQRLRKQNQPSSGHVYTEDDLSRPQILVPEDRQRLDEAGKSGIAPSPEEKAAAGQPAADQLSLGEIARRYRTAKEKNEQEATSSVPLPVVPTAAAAPGRTNVPRPQKRLKRVELEKPHWFPVVVTPAAPDRTNVPELQIQAGRKRTEPAMPRRATATVEGETQPQRPNAVQLRAGDTLWGIAKVYLGAGRRWPSLLAVNPNIRDPRRILVSSWIFLPTSEDIPADEVRLGRNDESSRSLSAARKPAARIHAKAIEAAQPLARGQFMGLAGAASRDDSPEGSSRRGIDRSQPARAVLSLRE